MRTRIALDAARHPIAAVRPNTKRHHRLPRRARLLRYVTGPVLICLGLLAGAVLSPTTARTDHRFDARHERRAVGAVGIALPPRLSFTPVAARWLAAWHAPHDGAKAPARAAAMLPPPSPPVLTDENSTTTPDWACIRLHESDDEFNSPTVPGGAYGFLEMTWLSLGYSGWPYEAPARVQSRAALFLHDELGWQPWSTRFVCGL